jgi:hypothetical protein
MYFTIFFYLFRSFLFYLLFKILTILKINTILSCISSQLTLLHAVLPIMFQSSLISKWCILSQVSYKNFLYKIPGISNIISYLLLSSNKYMTIIKILIIMIYSVVFVLFTIVWGNTTIFGLPWLACILYVFINIKKKIPFFGIVFVSTWLSQAVGTIIYGLLNGFLSYEGYIYLLPIAILERTLFSITSVFLFFCINFFDFEFKKIVEKKFKKKLILKL